MYNIHGRLLAAMIRYAICICSSDLRNVRSIEQLNDSLFSLTIYLYLSQIECGKRIESSLSPKIFPIKCKSARDGINARVLY